MPTASNDFSNKTAYFSSHTDHSVSPLRTRFRSQKEPNLESALAEGPKITAKEPSLFETHPHLKDFLPWLDLLNKESERGQVLISSGFLEQQLKEILQAFMIENSGTDTLFEGANAPLGTFSSRIAACFALGLITDGEHHDLSLIRKIRNDFAHNVHVSFATPSVASRCEALLSRAKDYPGVSVGTRGYFMTAATALILGIVNRAHYVGKERRILKQYPT
jgi:hypothetical protein